MVLDLPVLLLGVWVLLVVVLVRLGVDVYCCVCFLTVVMVTLCLRSILVFDWFSGLGVGCGCGYAVAMCVSGVWWILIVLGRVYSLGYGLVGD